MRPYKVDWVTPHLAGIPLGTSESRLAGLIDDDALGSRLEDAYGRVVKCWR